MINILYITSGIYYDPTLIQEQEKYAMLSEKYGGLIFTVAHKKEFRRFPMGRFCVQGIFLPKLLRDLPLIRNVVFSIYVFLKSILYQLGRKPFDVIIACDPFMTGILAFIISKLTGTKYIIDVVGIPVKSFQYDSENRRIVRGVKYTIVKYFSPFVLNRAHAIKLLYDMQLKYLSGFYNNNKILCFHEFVPIRQFKRGPDKKYILFLGYPWFLKGVDILIKAFNRISGEFPDYRLKIVGHCPDRKVFEDLARGNDRIEFHKAVRYEHSIELMESCSVFVLPSRTEAMGRVILEAMAAGKPVIASNVDGIPHYLRDGHTGLLFQSENDEDLANKLRIVLSDRKFSETLATSAHEYVHRHYNEIQYLNNLNKLICYAIRKTDQECVAENKIGGSSN
jgi:glycosyltransferase involved in cell wall biosynthesis